MQIRCAKCMKLFSNETKACPFCGHVNVQSAEESLFLKAGATIKERYIIGEVLGFGGFGATYAAWDIVLERRVAVKEYFPSAFATRKPNQNSLSVFSGDKGECFNIGLKKYLSEARTMAKLESIPHIVGVKEYFEENNTAYIVMEFVDGITMKEYLRKNGTLSPKDAIRLFLPLIKSLDQVHSDNVIHRDISPDNIMIDKNGFRLIDFGAAREVFENEEKTLSIVLKHGYAPEEQYHKKGKQGPWTDVYAMCATMYKCITGKTPPQVFDRMAGDEPETFSQLGISIAPHIEKAIFKGMSIVAEDRFRTMDELYNALATVETNNNFVRPKKSEGVTPVPDSIRNPYRETPRFTEPSVPTVAPVKTDSDIIDPVPPDKKKESNKPLIIMGFVAAALIIITAVTAIALFGRSGRQNNPSTEPSTSEQTASVAVTDASTTQASSTEATTEDSTEESSSSETTTTEKIVPPDSNKNQWSFLPAGDIDYIDGFKILIWGRYEDISSDAKITCEVNTHCCYWEDTQINNGELYETVSTFYLYDETCYYEGQCTYSVDYQDCDRLPIGGYMTDVDIDYVYRENYVEVSVHLPETLYHECECDQLMPIQYVRITVDDNTFVTPDGKGNEKWSNVLDNR